MTDLAERNTLDLEAYFARIGYPAERTPSLAVLQQVHLAHASHIPFENLDILLGLPIRLDLASLQAKLVLGQRGGYCFEQNLLFAAVLEQLGFAVTRLAARVRMGHQELLPRTHMLLKVDIEDGAWLADVGFGGEGILNPVPFSGETVEQFDWSYRVVKAHEQRVLQSLHDGRWLDLYAFTLEPQFPVDYEVANYYVSTHPGSIFVRSLTAQLPTPQARYILRNREFITERRGERVIRTLQSEEERLTVLAETMTLHFPQGTRFNHSLQERQ
jgi:N-hydroxyarylamine O-acetyltransferase